MEDNDFLLDNNLDDIILDYNEEDAEWDTFIDQIIQGNVIPVIGPEILCEDSHKALRNPHKTLLNYIAKKFNISSPIESFSELIYHKNFTENNQRDYIYSYINQILSRSRFTPSNLLCDLLSIKQFPFVITTSFTPIVENVMREIWGNKLTVMKFNNNPEENQDIRDDADLRNPTVYYMFGKGGDSAHRYVVTDIDMLNFCFSWIGYTENSQKNFDGIYSNKFGKTNPRPNNLINCLGKKYLLMIGNSYSDWLFRFIWYSLRSGLGNGLYACENDEDKLSRFLQRNQTLLRRPTKDTVEIIKNKLNKKLNERKKDDNIKFNTVGYGADVFISYSRRDADIAKKLYDILTERGINVWFDRNNITTGGKFLEEICQGIRTAKYFIPILTSSIEKEKSEPHLYRTEWEEAIQTSTLYGRTYIIPISEKDFNFYQASIPERLRQHNALEYASIDDMDEIANKIIKEINKPQ